MLNDIIWDAKGNDEICSDNSETKNSMLKDSLAVSGLSWDLDLKRSRAELTMANQMDLVTELQGKMLLNFAGSGHPIFRGTSALERGELRSKGSGKKSYTSMAAPKTLSCFSKWSSPSISPASTEQLRI